MCASARGASATVLEETRKETAPVQLPVSGPELAAMMKIGTRVMRGVDWKWGDQVFRYFINILAHLTQQSVEVRIGGCLNSGSVRLIDDLAVDF